MPFTSIKVTTETRDRIRDLGGQIALADLNQELRLPLLVLSNRRFHQMTGRALVAPAEHHEPFPWRVRVGDSSYAIDLARTVGLDNLGEVIGSATGAAHAQAARALHFITT